MSGLSTNMEKSIAKLIREPLELQMLHVTSTMNNLRELGRKRRSLSYASSNGINSPTMGLRRMTSEEGEELTISLPACVDECVEEVHRVTRVLEEIYQNVRVAVHVNKAQIEKIQQQISKELENVMNKIETHRIELERIPGAKKKSPRRITIDHHFASSSSSSSSILGVDDMANDSINDDFTKYQEFEDLIARLFSAAAGISYLMEKQGPYEIWRFNLYSIIRFYRHAADIYPVDELPVYFRRGQREFFQVYHLVNDPKQQEFKTEMKTKWLEVEDIYWTSQQYVDRLSSKHFHK